MRILLTNDDGVLSPVLHRAAEALATEHEVVVAAPALDQSGKSHAFTHGIHNLLTFGLEASSPWPLYRVDGTPADCVKFAVSHLLKDRPPHLVLSGPNLGENAGVSAVYSGTVAAAREAALWNIPALAVSLSQNTPAHLEHALEWLLGLLRGASPEGGGESAGSPGATAAQGPWPAPGTYWNINFPACAPGDVAGARFTRMSTVMFRDRYEPVAGTHGIPGHRLVGHKPSERFEPGTDDDVLRRNFIAVTPLQVSQGDESALAALKSLEGRLNAPSGLTTVTAPAA
jgi:5'-nucleotidase